MSNNSKYNLSNKPVVPSEQYFPFYPTTLAEESRKATEDIARIEETLGKFTIDEHYVNQLTAYPNNTPDDVNSIPQTLATSTNEGSIFLNDFDGKAWQSNGTVWLEIQLNNTTTQLTGVSNPLSESISGSASIQSIVNEENVDAHNSIDAQIGTINDDIFNLQNGKVDNVTFNAHVSGNEQDFITTNASIQEVETESIERDNVLNAKFLLKVDKTQYITEQRDQNTNINNNANAITQLELNQLKTVGNLFSAGSLLTTPPVPITTTKTFLTFGSQYVKNTSGLLSILSGNQTIEINNVVGTEDLQVTFNHSFTVKHLTANDVSIQTFIDKNTLADFTGTTTNIYTSPLIELNANSPVNETFSPTPIKFLVPAGQSIFIRIAHIETGASTDAQFTNAYFEMEAGRIGQGFSTVNDDDVINTETLSFPAVNQKIVNSTLDDNLIQEVSNRIEGDENLQSQIDGIVVDTNIQFKESLFGISPRIVDLTLTNLNKIFSINVTGIGGVNTQYPISPQYVRNTNTFTIEFPNVEGNLTILPASVYSFNMDVTTKLLKLTKVSGNDWNFNIVVGHLT